MLFVAVAARAMFKRDTFPYVTKNSAAKVNSIGWEFVELIGDESGPYKFVGGYIESMPVDRSASSKSSQWVNYRIDGQPKKYQIQTGDDFATNVVFFENPKGNHLLVIFEKRVR